MRNFFTRALSGLIYALIFLSCILFSKNSYLGLLVIFAIVCLWEFSKIIKAKQLITFIIPILLGVITIYYILPVKEFFVSGFTIAGLGILLFLLFSKKPINHTSLAQKSLLIFIYIILPFIYLAKLPFIDEKYTPNLIIYIILIIWSNDSFAFLVGKNFGKRKLFKSVSPKKTIEGFIGGLSFSILTGILIGIFSGKFSVVNWAIIGVIVSIFGTLGDLVESKFKRQAEVKDSGNLMPGHGGLLDRLDSLFFLAPFVYLYIHYIM